MCTPPKGLPRYGPDAHATHGLVRHLTEVLALQTGWDLESVSVTFNLSRVMYACAKARGLPLVPIFTVLTSTAATAYVLRQGLPLWLRLLASCKSVTDGLRIRRMSHNSLERQSVIYKGPSGVSAEIFVMRHLQLASVALLARSQNGDAII